MCGVEVVKLRQLLFLRRAWCNAFGDTRIEFPLNLLELRIELLDFFGGKLRKSAIFFLQGGALSTHLRSRIASRQRAQHGYKLLVGWAKFRRKLLQRLLQFVQCHLAYLYPGLNESYQACRMSVPPFINNLPSILQSLRYRFEIFRGEEASFLEVIQQALAQSAKGSQANTEVLHTFVEEMIVYLVEKG